MRERKLFRCWRIVALFQFFRRRTKRRIFLRKCENEKFFSLSADCRIISILSAAYKISVFLRKCGNENFFFVVGGLSRYFNSFSGVQNISFYFCKCENENFFRCRRIIALFQFFRRRTKRRIMQADAILCATIQLRIPKTLRCFCFRRDGAMIRRRCRLRFVPARE